LPRRAYADDAGWDLCAAEDASIAPGQRHTVGTGLAIEIPPGHAGLLVPRSGLAARYGVTQVDAVGVIDAGYRGEIKILVLNTDQQRTHEVAVGDRLSQLLVVPVAEIEFVETETLAPSERGERGLGSSGA
jgi:dUTP pyrophosphatase